MGYDVFTQTFSQVQFVPSIRDGEPGPETSKAVSGGTILKTSPWPAVPPRPPRSTMYISPRTSSPKEVALATVKPSIEGEITDVTVTSLVTEPPVYTNDSKLFAQKSE